MPSAVERLPSRITLLMDCCTVTFAYLRSATFARSVGRARRGITCPIPGCAGECPGGLTRLSRQSRSSLASLGRPLLRLRVLRAVERTTLHAILHARGVEGAADDVVLHRRKVGHPAAADEHDGVLLQVVADARDVRRDLHVIGETHPGDLAERGVRLLRGHRADDRADTTLLGRALAQLHEPTVKRVPRRAQRGRVHLRLLALPALADQLRDRWHAVTSPSCALRARTHAEHCSRFLPPPPTRAPHLRPGP